MPRTSAAPRRRSGRKKTAAGGSSGDSAPVAVRDRIAPVAAESAAADAHAGRGLAALVLIAFDQVEHPTNGRAIKAARLDLVHRQVLLDEGLEDGIQYFVRRQRI